MKSFSDFSDRINRHKDVFENLNPDNLLFWGCGNTALLYKFCFEKENLFPRFFVDSNRAIVHTKFINGIEVISPDEIKQFVDNPVVFIVSANPDIRKTIKDYCAEKNIFSVSVDEYVFYKNLWQIKTNYNQLEDAFSKTVCLEALFSRIDDTPFPEKLITDNQYFCLKQFLKCDKNEVFVDCGAFVGDSLESYIQKKSGVFGKAYAFEPDPSNYSALKYRTERLIKEWGYNGEKIIIENCGVDSYKHKINILSSESDLGAHISDNSLGQAVDIITLDDYFFDKKVSFIKADIESYESKMLDGAKNIIKRDHPLLAICIYHNASDFYQIQKQIRDTDNTYKFAVRHHTFFECDTVLYAY